MGMFDTTAGEVSIKRLKEARQEIDFLQDLLNKTKEAMTRHIKENNRQSFPQAFPIEWCSQIMKKSLNIFNEVARCNGATLVHSKK